ncbi:hypothetical protein N7493_011031 [Penicillium malachiteum]|uniref:Uncharacterized protein n=1 Tax=Penicillium malachiteum TaxID=1324776 RepID=A0AAD6HBE1_9EURO|nr:hypothetical protein N7493_011031 [Penicillium malachiteum]
MELIVIAVLMLGSEDNCLGIDFGGQATRYDQLLGLRDGFNRTALKSFEASLHFLTDDECLDIISSPDLLVWTYIGNLCSIIASQLELYRCQWRIRFEPYAKTSVAYGDSEHRERIRNLASTYSLQLRYLKLSLDNMRRLITKGKDDGDKLCTSYVETLAADFEYFVLELESLHLLCNEFLKDQVSKISLQEARISMSEAQDLKRLSYVGFVFAPLSLACSFFSVNVHELNGTTTPLWVFIVTSLGILSFSISVVALSRSGRVLSFLNSFLDGMTALWLPCLARVRNQPDRPGNSNPQAQHSKPPTDFYQNALPGVELEDLYVETRAN